MRSSAHALAVGLGAGGDVDFLELGQDQPDGAERRHVAGAHGVLHRLVQLSRSMSVSRWIEGRKLIARPAVGKANKLLKRLIN